jgi:CheY-like chemotaxis protein
LFEGTPILALSAAISQTEHEKLIQAGFSSFLAKPISPARLRSAIIDMFNAVDTQEES